MPENDQVVNDENNIQRPKVPYSERQKALETTQQYFEQHGASSVNQKVHKSTPGHGTDHSSFLVYESDFWCLWTPFLTLVTSSEGRKNEP
ncbi:hypothetical protein TNCV_2495571 [Trichonephila clavipes]|nr:hypothetical protein TNCV_2495571 [Trichonephila clavipes]